MYIIPPALFSSMHSVRNLKCVAKLASYEHDHGVILRQHNYQWLYCLHVHNHSVDTIYKHVQHSLPKDSFPPAEILKILSTEIAKCGPPNLNDDYLVPTEVTELVPNSDISNADQFCKVIVESQEDKISDHNEQQENSRSRSPDYRDDVRPSSCEAVRLQPNKSRMRRSRSREYEKSRSPDAFRNRRSRSRNNDQGRKRSRSRDRQWDNTSRSDDKVASAPKYSKTNSSFHSYSQGVIRDSNLTASSSESETDSIKDLHLFMDGIMTGTAPRIDARTVKKKVSSHSIPSKSK